MMTMTICLSWRRWRELRVSRPRWRRSIENLGRIHATSILYTPVNLCMRPIAEAQKTRTPMPHVNSLVCVLYLLHVRCQFSFQCFSMVFPVSLLCTRVVQLSRLFPFCTHGVHMSLVFLARCRHINNFVLSRCRDGFLFPLMSNCISCPEQNSSIVRWLQCATSSYFES